MFENDIDKLFKDKLSNREFEIKDSYIANLEKSLDAQKIYRRRFLITIFLLVLLASFIIGYYALNYGNESLSNKPNSEVELDIEIVSDNNTEKTLNNINKYDENTSELVTQKNSNDTPLMSRYNKPHINEKIKGDINNKVNQLSRIEKNIASNKKNLKDDQLTSSNIISTISPEKRINKPLNTEDKELNQKDIKLNSTANLGQLIDDKNVSLSNVNDKEKTDDIEPSSNFESKTTDSNESSNNESKEIENQNNKINTEKGALLHEDSIQNELNDNDEMNSENIPSTNTKKDTSLVLKNDGTITKNASDPSIIETTDTLNVDSLNMDNLNVENKDSTSKDNSTINDKTNYKKWNVSLYTGPTMISKTTSSNVSDNYLNKRDAEEKNITTINYGIEASYFFTKNINLSTGLNYLTYGENINYSEVINSTNNSIITSYNQTITFDSILGFDTTYTPVYTNQIVNETIIDSQTNKNRYSYLHIPFMIGYKVQLNKIGINVKVGGSLAFLIRKNGEHLNTEMTGIETADMKNMIYNIVTSSKFSYPIKKIDLFIEPRYQFKASNFLNNSLVNQKYSSLGVNIGASIKF
ncbi:MAG: hypothetical protein COB15_05320 [Flavobacteriales bacterium]|nr:MAG: hypothetical protein COB15_05320 [Flavobacteriales bacterium]